MKKMAKLITEANYDIELIEEDSAQHGKKLYLSGEFSRANSMVANGRIYKKDTLDREIRKLTEKISNNRLWGELGHPTTPETNLDRVAILTKELKWDNNILIGKAQVVEGTPCGNIVAALLKTGSIGISSRGLGTVDEQTKTVNDDFSLICYDVVSTPSNQASWVNGIYEAKSFEMEDDGDDEEDDNDEDDMKKKKDKKKKKLAKKKNKKFDDEDDESDEDDEPDGDEDDESDEDEEDYDDRKKKDKKKSKKSPKEMAENVYRMFGNYKDAMIYLRESGEIAAYRILSKEFRKLLK